MCVSTVDCTWPNDEVVAKKKKKTPKFECTIALFGQSSPWGDAAKRSKVKRGRKRKRERVKRIARRAADKMLPYPFLNEVPHHLAETVKFSQLATQSHCKRIGNMVGQQQGYETGAGAKGLNCWG